MNRLLPLLLIPLLTSCLATTAALGKMNLAIADVEQAAMVAKTAAENPDVTQAELDAAVATALESGKDAMTAIADVTIAMKEDVAANATRAAGLTGLGGGADGGVIGLGLTALAWWMRDRRKRRGGDPLQRGDIETPPTRVNNLG